VVTPEEQRICIGDGETFKKLFDDFYVSLCLFTERYIDDAEAANDLVQECFIKLWQKREDFQYVRQVKSFLYTSLRNAAINELDHRKVMLKYAEGIRKKTDEVFFHDQVVEEETYRILTHAIEQLPNQTQKVMQLALEGHDNKEIAALLDISDGTVHTLKKIAYKRLRQGLKDYWTIDN